MPAATSAPNAKTRMISVSGTEKSPAFFRSLKNSSVTALFVLSPTDPMVNSGLACCSFFHAGDDRVDLVGGVIGKSADLDPDEHRPLVVGDEAHVLGIERRLDLRDRIEAGDPVDH